MLLLEEKDEIMIEEDTMHIPESSGTVEEIGDFNSSDNCSFPCSETDGVGGTRPFTVYVAISLVSLIIVLGFSGNLLVIFAVKTTQKLQTISSLFVVNLSVCDLMFVCMVLPFNVYTYVRDGWDIDQNLCRLVGYLGYCLTGTTIITITLIAYNRYKMVLDISGHKRTFTPKKFRIMIGAAWFVPALLLIPPLTEVWGKFGYEPMLVTCNLLLDHPSQLFKLFLLVVRIGIPFCFILYFYGKIYRTMRQSHKRIHKSASTLSALEISNQKKELHLTKMMVAIFVVFIASYLPCTITGMIDWNSVLSKQFHMFCAITVYIGCAANPVIYGLMNGQFREAYFRIVCFWGNKYNAIQQKNCRSDATSSPAKREEQSKQRSDDSGVASETDTREPTVSLIESSKSSVKHTETGCVNWSLE